MYQTEAKLREPGHQNDPNGPKWIIKGMKLTQMKHN